VGPTEVLEYVEKRTLFSSSRRKWNPHSFVVQPVDQPLYWPNHPGSNPLCFKVLKIFRNTFDGRDSKRLRHREDGELKNKTFQTKKKKRKEYRIE
jgi:hypothetical protein